MFRCYERMLKISIDCHFREYHYGLLWTICESFKNIVLIVTEKNNKLQVEKDMKTMRGTETERQRRQMSERASESVSFSDWVGWFIVLRVKRVSALNPTSILGYCRKSWIFHHLLLIPTQNDKLSHQIAVNSIHRHNAKLDTSLPWSIRYSFWVRTTANYREY